MAHTIIYIISTTKPHLRLLFGLVPIMSSGTSLLKVQSNVGKASKPGDKGDGNGDKEVTNASQCCQSQNPSKQRHVFFKIWSHIQHTPSFSTIGAVFNANLNSVPPQRFPQPAAWGKVVVISCRTAAVVGSYSFKTQS